MNFRVMSHMQMQQIPEEEVIARLRKLATAKESDIWICDDLSLFEENKLSLVRKLIWQLAKHFYLLKAKLYHIDPQQTTLSFNLIEKEIAKDLETQKRLGTLFQAVIKKYNKLYNKWNPYQILTLPIHAAVISNDLSTVIKLVERNKNHLYQTNSQGETPLHVALRLKETAIADFLIMEHPYPTEADSLSGSTPLHLAVVNNDMAIVKSLLEKNIPPDIPDSEGHTPFELAFQAKNKSLCKLLQEYIARRANRFSPLS